MLNTDDIADQSRRYKFFYALRVISIAHDMTDRKNAAMFQDVHLYDLVLNLSLIDATSAVNIICLALREKG